MHPAPKHWYTCTYPGCDYGSRLITYASWWCHRARHNPALKKWKCHHPGCAYHVIRRDHFVKHLFRVHHQSHLCRVCKSSACDATCEAPVNSSVQMYESKTCMECSCTFESPAAFTRHKSYQWHTENVRQKDVYRVFGEICDERTDIIIRCELPIGEVTRATFRPDFTIRSKRCDKVVIILEIDGNQHRNLSISGEQDRMLTLMCDARRVNLDHSIHFIRWNPHAYSIDGVKQITPDSVRCSVLKRVILSCLKDRRPMSIRHLFYDAETLQGSTRPTLVINRSPFIKQGALYLYDDPIFE